MTCTIRGAWSLVPMAVRLRTRIEADTPSAITSPLSCGSPQSSTVVPRRMSTVAFAMAYTLDHLPARTVEVVLVVATRARHAVAHRDAPRAVERAARQRRAGEGRQLGRGDRERGGHRVGYVHPFEDARLPGEPCRLVGARPAPPHRGAGPGLRGGGRRGGGRHPPGGGLDT